MKPSTKPIGWATTISSLISIPREMWDSVMTVEKSPLRNLDPMVGHMIFQCLFFIWSGIFAVMVGSFYAFGISAAFHILLISGITITAVIFRQAEKNPESLNSLLKSGRKYNGRANGGEHE
jgi:hypothetical protein|tara:strand:- start:594 stop:956 length:363 start_codon:yes stop_codon:yes gene_type:complete